MPEAGWYDDPQDQAQLRWWDGARWTERRQPRSSAEMPPPAPPAPPAGGSYGIPLGDTGGAGAGSAGAGGAGAGSGGTTGDSSSAWDTASDGSDWAASGSAGWSATGAGAFTEGGATLTGEAPPRSFVDAIKVCFTKFVDAKGRASRSEFWYFALFALIADTVTGGIAIFVLLLPSITVQVRRLHDIGKSAWALLWILVPFVGLIVLIVYAVRPGEPHTNAYG